VTKEFYNNVILMVKNMVPPPATLAEAVTEAAPIWEQLTLAVSDPNEESALLLILSAQTMMTFFSQALLQEIRDDIHFLRTKEVGTGMRVKIATP
jgi:hypothetical protein